MNDELKNQMAAKLQYALERVVDERSLIHFLRVLGHDWHTERQLEADVPLSPYAHGSRRAARCRAAWFYISS